MIIDQLERVNRQAWAEYQEIGYGPNRRHDLMVMKRHQSMFGFQKCTLSDLKVMYYSVSVNSERGSDHAMRTSDAFPLPSIFWYPTHHHESAAFTTKVS